MGKKIKYEFLSKNNNNNKKDMEIIVNFMFVERENRNKKQW